MQLQFSCKDLGIKLPHITNGNEDSTVTIGSAIAGLAALVLVDGVAVSDC
jgi:hypothetical protein